MNTTNNIHQSPASIMAFPEYACNINATSIASPVTSPASMTLREWGQIWYEDYQSQVQASTYSGYKYTLKIILAHMGDMQLHHTLPIHINRLQDMLVKEGYSLSAVQKCRSMLIQIYDAAEYNGLIVGNPARKSKVIRDRGTISGKHHFKDAFSDLEIMVLEEHLPNDLMGNSILAMIYSGTRVQELIALSPEDIAPDGSEIVINKAIKMVDGVPTLGPPKSRTSNRSIPIPEKGRKYFIFLRNNGGKTHIWSLPGRNEYYGVGAFRNHYYRTLSNIKGVRKLSPHCCRHTYVTMLQARGVPLDLITRLVGHSKLVTTVGYTHTSDDTLANAVSALDTAATVKISA